MSKFADIKIDPSIVKRAACGDARAHEIIYRAFATPVYSICLRFTKVPAHAEDLVQETFIEVMRSIARFRGEAALGSWIRRIAVTKALMFLRSAWTKRGQSLAEAPCRHTVYRVIPTMRWTSMRRWLTYPMLHGRLYGCMTSKDSRTRK